jgi:hypothetical protein
MNNKYNLYNLTDGDIDFIKSTFKTFLSQLKEDAEFEDNNTYFSLINKYENKCKSILNKLK